eukprot:5704144-Amphidinium_carterae.1
MDFNHPDFRDLHTRTRVSNLVAAQEQNLRSCATSPRFWSDAVSVSRLVVIYINLPSDQHALPSAISFHSVIYVFWLSGNSAL